MKKMPKVSSLFDKESAIEITLEQLMGCQYLVNENSPPPNKKTKAHLVGGHLSPFKGRGMEFSEVRQYQAGDDIRTIDWRVTARTGKVHTKIFQEERERPVFIVLDLQDSMYFGSQNRFKSNLAVLQAARCFWLAFNSGNRVGALLSSKHEHIEIKPSNRRKDGLRLLQQMVELHNRQLSRLYQDASTDYSNIEYYSINSNALLDSLSRLSQLAKSGSFIYIFSDFYELNESYQQHLSYLSRSNDIYAVQVTDPLEENIPVAGHYRLTDGDNVVSINANKKSLVARYQERFTSHSELLQTKFHQVKAYFAQVSTADALTDLWLNPSASDRRASATKLAQTKPNQQKSDSDYHG